MVKIFNSLTKKIEEFATIEPKKVRMYSCGPTVYDNVHIGNLRAYLFNDLLKRVLLVNGYEVNQVMNVTDIDDKTIRGSAGKETDFQLLTKEYEEKFLADFSALNMLMPTKIARATEYIDKIVAFVEDLVEKGFAYKADDGSVYFSIAKFRDYGQLANLSAQDLKSGARVSQDEYDKENPADFALWKAWDADDGEIFWQTSLGKGRPGWSIECSVMSMENLGDTIDIHTGGVDLIFPHHENEIAQSEAHSGKKFVNFWIHNEHLLVDGKKMSKSLHNFYILNDITDKGFSPLDFRYFCFGAHYRSKLNFTWEGLEAAKNAREKIKRFVMDNPISGEVCQIYDKKFMSKLDNDLATPEALAVVWELIRDDKKDIGKKIATLKKWDKEILSFGLFETVEIPTEIMTLAEARKTARQNKDFAKSDELRAEIKRLGWNIEDLADENYKLSKI